MARMCGLCNLLQTLQGSGSIGSPSGRTLYDPDISHSTCRSKAEGSLDTGRIFSRQSTNGFHQGIIHICFWKSSNKASLDILGILH